MLYNRLWFHRDHYGLTIGGGRINKSGTLPGVAAPDQRSDGSFRNTVLYRKSGDPFKSLGRVRNVRLDAEPIYYVPFGIRHRAAMYRIFSGPGGVTPTSCPTAPVVENICGSPGALVPSFTPDLKKIENRIGLSILVKF